MPWVNMGGWTAVVIIIVVLLLFGAAKLPALAKSAGQSFKIFKKEMKSENTADPAAPAAEGESSTTVVNAESSDDTKPADPPTTS